MAREKQELAEFRRQIEQWRRVFKYGKTARYLM
jgi:hypothetical protein